MTCPLDYCSIPTVVLLVAKKEESRALVFYRGGHVNEVKFSECTLHIDIFQKDQANRKSIINPKRPSTLTSELASNELVHQEMPETPKHVCAPVLHHLAQVST